jgi:hypothetical protein
MHKHFFDLLPYFSFECSQALVDELLVDIKNIDSNKIGKETINNKLNTTLVNTNGVFYNENLLLWLDQCLLNIKKELHIKPELNIPVVSCWANKSTKLEGHHQHTHPNSFLSGILYLTTHESGYTHFFQKNHFFEKFQTYTLTDIINVEEKIKPTAGKLIIFPSHLEHKVSGLVSNEVRYTISFNAFFSGKLGKFSSDLDMSVKTVREIVNCKK